MLKKLLAITVCLLPFAFAQDMTADQILDKLRERNETVQDVSFLLTGTIFDQDGQEIALEIESQFMPQEELVRAYFYQPDALADNFIVIDGQTVYNYLYVTNQVTILDASDPEALGGLIPADQLKGSINVTPDLTRFFDEKNWKASVQGYEDSDAGPVYKMRFDNVKKDANIKYVDIDILDQEWLPTTMSFIQTNDKPLSELQFNDYQIDQGLDPAELRDIPADAERIDERGN